MKKLILLTLLLSGLLFAGCGSKDPEPSCADLWEIEINNPDAIVEVRDGSLHFEIENPQTDHDVRLIQRQHEYHPPGSIGIFVYFENMENVATGSNDFDMELKASYAYDYDPDNIIASIGVGKFGIRVNSDKYYQAFSYDGPSSGYMSLGGSGEVFSIGGDTDVSEKLSRANNPISTIQADPMIFYLDFGINEYAQFGKSTSIKVDVTEVRFTKGTGDGEFANDTFDCNSLN